MLDILTKISLDSHLNGRRFQMINEFLNVFDFFILDFLLYFVRFEEVYFGKEFYRIGEKEFVLEPG